MKFRNFFLVIFFTILTLLNINSHARSEFGIVTGGETGTYIKIGKDISSLMALSDIKLNVHTSNGSLENVYSVFKLPKAQMGIVQSDVLAFIASKKDAQLKRMTKKIRLLHPLYNEEVHLLARKRIQSIEDLAGKRVAMGKEGSGTFLTADTILNNLLGINVKQIYSGGNDALNKLKKGEIDAMFYVAGYPVTLFEQKVQSSDDLHLIPIQDKELAEIYPASSIPANTYKWQENLTETIAVKAVLITYDYKRSDCQNVGRMARLIESQIGWLRENGHEKWNNVDLSFELPGWVQYECVDNNISIQPVEKDGEYKDYLRRLRKQSGN